jgi:hypothetical protein
MVKYIHRLLDTVRNNRIEIVPIRFGMMLLVCLLVAVTVLSCSTGEKQNTALATGSYPIHPVDLRDVKLTDRF